MTQINLPSLTILCFDVPEGATWFDITIAQGVMPPQLQYNFGALRFGREYIELPSGSWQILGRLDEITEEQAKGIVQSHTVYGSELYRNYETNGFSVTAIESLHSTLKANQIDGNPLLLIDRK